MIGSIPPLVEVKGDEPFTSSYRVICRDCGDVTREESGFTAPEVGVRLTQAALFRQRHLARHLSALANEIQDASR